MRNGGGRRSEKEERIGAKATVASTSCATRRGSYAANRRVIEVLRSLRGAAVGAALCKALEAARSSPSSIRTARVSVDYRRIRIIRKRSILEEAPSEEKNICSGKRAPTLKSTTERKKTTKRTRNKGKKIPKEK